MDISALLGVERGVTALIGGGGKTTLMCTLAEELRRRGTVVVTTSTHIQRPEQYPVLLSGGAAAVSAALAAHGAVCVAGETAEGKLTAPALSFETLAQLADFVLVEADGAKRLPLKARPSRAGDPSQHPPDYLCGGSRRLWPPHPTDLSPPGALRRPVRRGGGRCGHA